MARRWLIRRKLLDKLLFFRFFNCAAHPVFPLHLLHLTSQSKRCTNGVQMAHIDVNPKALLERLLRHAPESKDGKKSVCS